MRKAKDKDIKTIFYDLYNENIVFGQHTTNQSLQKKLDRFRDNMAVDFYNLVMESENNEQQIFEFMYKYLLSDKFGQTIEVFGKQTNRMVFDWKTLFLNGNLEMFNTITDKVIAKEELTQEELQVINNWLCGYISQNKKDSGGFILLKQYVVVWHFGMIKALYEWIVLVSQGQVDVSRCEAPGCNKLFIPDKRGIKQIYCGATCKKRAFRHRKQLELNIVNT